MGAIQQVLASYGSAVGDGAFSGALVRHSSTVAGSGGIVSFNTEVYDTDAWHSTSSDTDRMTVPTSTSLVRCVGNATNNNNSTLPLNMFKESAAFYGGGNSVAVPSSFDAICNVASALIEVSPATWFQLGNADNEALTNNEYTWFSAERVPSATKRALVRKSGTQSIGAGTTVDLTFDTEVYDVGGWFDSGSSATEFVVPSGTSGYVRICANFDPGTTLTTDQKVLGIRKASVYEVGCVARDTTGRTTDRVNGVTAVLAVSPGDTFAVNAFCTSAATIQANESTWFSIEELLNFHGCLIYKTGSQGTASGVEEPVEFGGEEYDTDNTHDSGTDNTRITVPVGSGFTRARASFGLASPSATSYTRARVLKNGSHFFGSPSYLTDTAGADFLSGMGAWVDVSEGDYFQLGVTTGGAKTFAADNRTWLCVEFQ